MGRAITFVSTASTVAVLACSGGGAIDPSAGDLSGLDGLREGEACAEGDVCVRKPDRLVFLVPEGVECPVGFGAGASWLELPSDPIPLAQCTCECGRPSKHAACTGEPVSIAVSQDSTCSLPSMIASGLCQTTLAGDAAYASATPLPPVQASCVAAPKVAEVQPPSFGRVRVCTETQHQPPCGPSLTCGRLEPPPGGRACVESPGGNCDLPGRHVELATSFLDDRGCSPCECETTDTCTNARLEFHDPADPNCSKAPKSVIAADGQCHPTGYTTSWLEYHADLAPSETCRVTKPSEPTGYVRGQGDRRFYCCQ